MEWLVKSIGDVVSSGSQLVRAVESGMEDFDASVKDLVGGLEAGTLGEEGEDQIDFDSPENAHLKITEEVKDYVRKLSKSPGTFMKHPRRKDASEFNMTKPQQQHARIILQEVPEFSRFRYTLSPMHLQEVVFWRIYFDLLEHFQIPLVVVEPDAAQDGSTPSLASGGKRDPPKVGGEEGLKQVSKKTRTSQKKSAVDDSPHSTTMSDPPSEDIFEVVSESDFGELEGEDSYITDFTTTTSQRQKKPVSV